MEKETYIAPEMEIVAFEAEDVITASRYETDELPLTTDPKPQMQA